MTLRRFCCFALSLVFLAVTPVPLIAAPTLARLQGPLSVIHVGELRDGGTLTLGLADLNGLGDGVLFNYKHGSKTQGRLYADGQLVPLGSLEEQQVLLATQRYINAQFTPAQQAALVSGTLTNAAHTYGERGYYACRLLRAVIRLKRYSRAD